MKIKFIIFATFAIFFTANIFAQNSPAVSISSTKVVYERKGQDVPDHKKTFEVNYPKVSGIKDPRVQKNLENTIDLWKNFETSLEENLDDYHWLERLDHEVKYIDSSLLVIELVMEGSGAYPDGSVKTLVVNLNTGKRLFLKDAFTNFGQLLVKIDKAQKDEIKKHLADLKKEYPEDADSAQEMFDRNKYSANVLEEFSIDDKGVTFIFEYGFPHAIKALEPEGRYFFSWAEMKPFIDSKGLLARFVR